MIGAWVAVHYPHTAMVGFITLQAMVFSRLSA